jgi:hypothetical protein
MQRCKEKRDLRLAYALKKQDRQARKKIKRGGKQNRRVCIAKACEKGLEGEKDRLVEIKGKENEKGRKKDSLQ